MPGISRAHPEEIPSFSRSFWNWVRGLNGRAPPQTRRIVIQLIVRSAVNYFSASLEVCRTEWSKRAADSEYL